MRVRSDVYLVGLGALTAVSVVLMLLESLVNREFTHSYLLWNLFLAWVPLLLTFWLERTLRYKLWSSWEGLLVSLGWLVFLPNSFYLISDYVHLAEVSSRQLPFAVVVTTAFAFTGIALGVTSLYIVHREIRKRFDRYFSSLAVGATLFITSGAIYIGRDLRWNSWDVLFNPFGLLFDVTERLLHPAQYPEVLVVVLPFFILLTTIYFFVWQTMKAFAD